MPPSLFIKMPDWCLSTLIDRWPPQTNPPTALWLKVQIKDELWESTLNWSLMQEEWTGVLFSLWTAAVMVRQQEWKEDSWEDVTTAELWEDHYICLTLPWFPMHLIWKCLFSCQHNPNVTLCSYKRAMLIAFYIFHWKKIGLVNLGQKTTAQNTLTTICSCSSNHPEHHGVLCMGKRQSYCLQKSLVSFCL